MFDCLGYTIISSPTWIPVFDHGLLPLISKTTVITSCFPPCRQDSKGDRHESIPRHPSPGRWPRRLRCRKAPATQWTAIILGWNVLKCFEGSGWGTSWLCLLIGAACWKTSELQKQNMSDQHQTPRPHRYFHQPPTWWMMDFPHLTLANRSVYQSCDRGTAEKTLPRCLESQQILKFGVQTLVPRYSPPARWGSLDFKKGATPSPSLLPPPSPPPEHQIASPGCCGACLDPNSKSPAQDCAWTRTHARENAR